MRQSLEPNRKAAPSFVRPACPETSCTRLRGIPKCDASVRISSSLAAPSTGGAASATSSCPARTPTIRLFDALGLAQIPSSTPLATAFRSRSRHALSQHSCGAGRAARARLQRLMRRPLLLNGFMGAGKSTVGRELSRATGRPFIDLDERVEARVGTTVAEYFSRHGEARFREVEREVFSEVLAAATKAAEPPVIALGGGASLARSVRLRALEDGRRRDARGRSRRNRQTDRRPRHASTAQQRERPGARRGAARAATGSLMRKRTRV